MAQVVEGGSNGWVEVGGHPDLSMKLVMSRTTRSITRVFMIESPTGVYDEVNAFLAECRPAFSPPGKYPILGVQLYVDTVNIEPYGAVGKDDLGKPVQINGFPSYESFKATVTYTPLPYQPKNPNQPSPDPLLDNLEIVAKRTTGFSGASLANLMNEAAIVAARNGKTEISYTEIDYSIDRLTVGMQKTTGMTFPDRQRLVA